MTTFSPARIVCPPSSTSSSAVRFICATAVYQRIASGTKLEIKSGFSRSLRYWSGNWCRAKTLPVSVLRVVSFPPTISRSTFPMYSAVVMESASRDEASMETRSNPSTLSCRSTQSLEKYACISSSSFFLDSQLSTTPLPGSDREISDQRVSPCLRKEAPIIRYPGWRSTGFSDKNLLSLSGLVSSRTSPLNTSWRQLASWRAVRLGHNSSPTL